MMKRIIYTRPDGMLVIVHPVEGARLANAITLADGEVVTPENGPIPIDQLMRRWPVAGATADWAETEDDFVKRIATKDVPPEGMNVRFVNPEAIPADRTFRDAWQSAEAGIELNMTKARGIHKDRLRAARAPMLAALDIKYQRADEAGDASKKAAIASAKQALRDATNDPLIEAATNGEELKAAIPAALK